MLKQRKINQSNYSNNAYTYTISKLYVSYCFLVCVPMYAAYGEIDEQKENRAYSYTIYSDCFNWLLLYFTLGRFTMSFKIKIR